MFSGSSPISILEKSSLYSKFQPLSVLTFTKSTGESSLHSWLGRLMICRSKHPNKVISKKAQTGIRMQKIM
jgi:hypothetical protein